MARIASELALSVYTVKSFCRRNEVKAQAEQPKPKLQMDEKPCHFCGRPVLQLPGRKEKKFCSDRCRNRWWNAHQKTVRRAGMERFVCPSCGKTFYAYAKRHPKYCSHVCYIADRFGGDCA